MRKQRNEEQGKCLTLFETDVGCGGVVAGEKGLVEVFLPFSVKSQVELAQRILSLYPGALRESPLTRHAADLLERYFAGERISFDLSVDLSGFSSFQTAVYKIVSAIPYGSVLTYGEVAELIGRSRAARGVGGAMATNPLPIVIPCHRVVGAKGNLTGYSGPGGVNSKKWLLDLEGAADR